MKIIQPKKTFVFSLLLLFIISISTHAQVGIGTTTPNADALLDIDATTTSGGLLLPRIALSGTSSPAPLTAHVPGMTVYNTATTGNVSPGVYINSGAEWARIEDLTPTSSVVELTGDIEISSPVPTLAAVPGIPDLTFTARKTTVMVLLTASGFGYTNSMAYVELRVRNVTTSTDIGGTTNKIQSYDDVTGTITTWSASFSKLLTGLTIGTTYTLRVQGAVGGVLGTPNAAIYTTSFPQSQHMTLSVSQ